jgi:hypothetical protein
MTGYDLLSLFVPLQDKRGKKHEMI